MTRSNSLDRERELLPVWRGRILRDPPAPPSPPLHRQPAPVPPKIKG